jgi:RsiW-degrading membrane proteinase PrsW (M82 family)
LASLVHHRPFPELSRDTIAHLARPTGSAAAHVVALVAILIMLGLALVTMVLVALETGAAGLAVGLLLALLPLPIYLALSLWIDRYEKEPLIMIALAFLWGASVAVFFSYILNSLVGLVFIAVVGESFAQVGGAIFSAPLVEESAKGGALFLLYFWKRDEFDNVTDGILYAAMVGLGFATTENVLYYGNAFAEGIHGPLIAFFLRGILSPFSHPLFTAMTGIGLGLAREARRGSWMLLAPAAGLVLAMLLHAAWNLSASLGAVFFATYLFIMVPFFLGTLALIAWSLKRERTILRAHLAPYAAAGELSAEDLERIVSPGSRFRSRLAAARAEGLRGWRRTGTFHHAAGELAFHRWRQSRGLGRGSTADLSREHEVLERLRASRARRFSPPGTPPVIRAGGGAERSR